jgi:hypothetical protein
VRLRCAIGVRHCPRAHSQLQLQKCRSGRVQVLRNPPRTSTTKHRICNQICMRYHRGLYHRALNGFETSSNAASLPREHPARHVAHGMALCLQESLRRSRCPDCCWRGGPAEPRDSGQTAQLRRGRLSWRVASPPPHSHTCDRLCGWRLGFVLQASGGAAIGALRPACPFCVLSCPLSHALYRQRTCNNQCALCGALVAYSR